MLARSICPLSVEFSFGINLKKEEKMILCRCLPCIFSTNDAQQKKRKRDNKSVSSEAVAPLTIVGNLVILSNTVAHMN